MTSSLPAVPSADEVERADEILQRLVPAAVRVALAAKLGGLEHRSGSQHVEVHLNVRGGKVTEGDVRPHPPLWVANGGGR